MRSSALLMVIYISGLVLLFRARKKNLVRLDAGLLPPPKKHRFGNIFLTSGVAAAIAMFVLTFILSLM